eukprot:3857964-Pleurochrysis_carterae.AAC.2
MVSRGGLILGLSRRGGVASRSMWIRVGRRTVGGGHGCRHCDWYRQRRRRRFRSNSSSGVRRRSQRRDGFGDVVVQIRRVGGGMV